MAMGYGAESIGLRMAELSSAVAANIKYALDLVAVGGKREGQAIFQEQNLGRARRVQAADADVGPQAEAFLVADDHARHLAQRLGDREHAGALELGLIEHLRTAGLRGGTLLRADHHDPVELGGIVGEGGAADGGDAEAEQGATERIHGRRSRRRDARRADST